MENEELTIESIREHIANDSLEHVRECHEENIVMYFVIQSFPGSAKTTSVMKAIDEAGYTWLYLSPTHSVVKENLEFSRLHDYDFVHLKGKNQEGMCLAPEYIELMKRGVNIKPFCETRCMYRRNGCPYYETKEKIESYPQCWAGVHAHIPTYLQTFLYTVEYNGQKMFNHYDVIILDEFPLQVLYNQSVIDREDVLFFKDVVDRIPDSNEKTFIKDFCDCFLTGDINHNRMKSLLMNRALSLSDFEKEYDVVLLRLVSNNEIERTPINLCNCIKAIHKSNPSIKVLKWMVYEIKKSSWSKPAIYITTSNIGFFSNIPIPIICLDATAEVNAWNMLLNDNCRSEKIDMKYNKLYHLEGGKYPVSTWVGGDKNKLSSSGERLCYLIKEICKRKKKAVLICSNKRIRKLIKEYMKENYDGDNFEFAIYYNLRGRNTFYENCDTCIIAHEPNIPPFQLEIISNVMGWDQDLLRDLMTTAEIKQAIGRIRQNISITPNGRIRENIEIYVFPGGISESDKIVEEAKIIPYDFMLLGELKTLNSKIKEAIKRKGGVISKTDLYQSFSKYSIPRSLIDRLLINLWKIGYISNYKRNISWDFDKEKERKEIKYNRSIDNFNSNF